MTSLRPGAHFASKYTVLRRLGTGGFGAVYLVENELRWQLALKVLHEDIGRRPTFRRRFLREMELARGLIHANAVPVRDAGEAGGLLYFTMDFVAGRTVEEILQSEQPVEPRRAVAWMVQLLGFLEYLHEKGFVHRDLKPANLMIEVMDGREHLRVLDLGIAKALVGEEGQTMLTGSNLVGTIPYMATEHLAGDAVDHRIDIWATGVILYECCAGQRPFHSESWQKLVHKIHNEAPTGLEHLAGDMPSELSRAVGRALCKNRDGRFPDARSFREALESLDRSCDTAGSKRSSSGTRLAGTRLQPDPTALQRRPRSAKRRTVRACLVVLVCFSAIVWVMRGPFGSMNESDVTAPNGRDPVRRRTPAGSMQDPAAVAPTRVEPADLANPVGTTEGSAEHLELLVTSPEVGRGKPPEGLRPRPDLEVIPGQTQRDGVTGYLTPLRDPETGIELVLIPSTPAEGALVGTAERGITTRADEDSRLQVVYLKPFYLGRTEVSWAQWNCWPEAPALPMNLEQFAELWGPERVGLDHPVLSPTWRMASDYCSWAGYRLPTEAEWEWAAQDAYTSVFGLGPEGAEVAAARRRANVWDRTRVDSAWGVPRSGDPAGFDDGFEFTAPVGSFEASPRGLHDVVGNALEWCADEYDSKVDESSSGQHVMHVAKGGSYNRGVSDQRITRRFCSPAGQLWHDIGFRVCLELPDRPESDD